MHERIRDVMSTNVVTVRETASLYDAARMMRDRNIGDVIVTRGANDEVCGILTDRDIVVRGLADRRAPDQTTAGEVCTGHVFAISPEDGVDRAIKLMRQNAIRRLPVMENGRPVGIVSLGDLAVERDPKSVLGQVSAAPPNNLAQVGAK